MKPANATFGRKPSNQSPYPLRPQDSQTRLAGGRAPRASSPSGALTSSAGQQGVRQSASASSAERRTQRSSEEPRTGVVRRVDAPPARPSGAPEQQTPAAPAGVDGRRDGTGTWRCLEWGEPQKARRGKRNAKLTIVELSASGDLVRQDGPDASLPEMGDFMHRMARLVAQGLGYQRCRSLCLKGPTTVVAISEVSSAKVMAVSGPTASMSNVLRRSGLE